jgi:hypothetical protein
LQNRPAEARAFFVDHPTAEAKSPGYEVGAETPRLADNTIVFSEYEVFKVIVMVTLKR